MCISKVKTNPNIMVYGEVAPKRNKFLEDFHIVLKSHCKLQEFRMLKSWFWFNKLRK